MGPLYHDSKYKISIVEYQSTEFIEHTKKKKTYLSYLTRNLVTIIKIKSFQYVHVYNIVFRIVELNIMFALFRNLF